MSAPSRFTFDPESAMRVLDDRLVFRDDGCARLATPSLQVSVKTAAGVTVKASISCIAYASVHHWCSPSHAMERRCGNRWCHAPAHLTSTGPGYPLGQTVDLDRVAAMRAEGLTWGDIEAQTGWRAADVAAIPHVRRIHDDLKTEARLHTRSHA